MNAKSTEDRYRLDKRTKEEFAYDISKFTKREGELLKIYEENVEKLNVKDTGCDNTGSYLPLEAVTTDADFGYVEIKSIQFMPDKYVHFKIKQVASYKKQGAKILFFIDTPPDIRYAWIEPEQLEKYKIVDYWEKKCYEVPIDDIPLHRIKRKVPEPRIKEKTDMSEYF